MAEPKNTNQAAQEARRAAAPPPATAPGYPPDPVSRSAQADAEEAQRKTATSPNPKRIRHETRRGETLLSSFGPIRIDELGFVENMHELQAKPDQLLQITGFQDGDKFWHPDDADGSTGKKAGKRDEQARKLDEMNLQAQAEQTLNRPGDEDVKNLIRELEADPKAPRNSAGYLDMGHVNEALRQRKWPVISGTKRVFLTDQIRATAPQAAAGGVLPKLQSPGIDPRVTSGGINTPLHTSDVVDESRATANVMDDNKVPPLPKTQT
jgi:hypothetical protein